MGVWVIIWAIVGRQFWGFGLVEGKQRRRTLEQPFVRRLR